MSYLKLNERQEQIINNIYRFYIKAVYKQKVVEEYPNYVSRDLPVLIKGIRGWIATSYWWIIKQEEFDQRIKKIEDEITKISREM